MGGSIRFGICTDQAEPYATLADRWRYFEELGFDSIWDCDHFIRPSDPSCPYFEGWTLLAALSAVTSRIRVGVLVSSNTFRHPALVAQQALTIDHISGGRLELGLGAGWFEEEHERFGILLDDPPVRVDRFREAVEVIDSLVRGRSTTYDGRYYQLRDARLRPKPVQSPRPPLTLGAHRPRMLRICARFRGSLELHRVGGGDGRAQPDTGPGLHGHRTGPQGDNPLLLRMGIPYEVPGSPDPWSSPDAFSEVVGMYAEVGVNEFILDQPRPEQFGIAEQIAAEVMKSRR